MKKGPAGAGPFCCLLKQCGYKRKENGCENACGGERQAAHRAGKLGNFVCSGGAHHMGGGAWQIVQYAMEQGKVVINLYNK